MTTWQALIAVAIGGILAILAGSMGAWITWRCLKPYEKLVPPPTPTDLPNDIGLNEIKRDEIERDEEQSGELQDFQAIEEVAK